MATNWDRNFSKEGLPNESVERFPAAIRKQRRLNRWYSEMGKACARPTENEVVAHMILPFLLALGWSEQLLAVEWRSMDLAAFRETPTVERTCVLMCEAKGLGQGLESALAQAMRYPSRLHLDACRKIILTDGGRMYLYERSDGRWGEGPIGYLNVEKIRAPHIAPQGASALDTIVSLAPAGIERSTQRKAPQGESRTAVG